ncbi:hypothetical protein IFT69_15755 [Pseudomonas putida]|nr:hypothetical protein [Pseudomonas putida]
MSWPVCFDAKTIKRIDKSWSLFPAMVKDIQSLTCSLYDACLSEGVLSPVQIRESADLAVKSNLGLYSVADWSKIVYRLGSTLECLISSVEKSLTIEEVNLVEARFELGYFDGIDAYARRLALGENPRQALQLAERMHDAGSDGWINCLQSSITECSGSDDSAALKMMLAEASDERMAWALESKISFWRVPTNALSPLVHVQRLLDGEYPWNTISVQFVQQRLGSDIQSSLRIKVHEMFEGFTDDEKEKFLSAVYAAQPPDHLKSTYKAIVHFLQPSDVLNMKPMELVSNALKGDIPRWLKSVLSTQAQGLARFQPTIESVTLMVLNSSPEIIAGIALPERFAQEMQNYVSNLADEARHSYPLDDVLFWDDYGNKAVKAGPNIGTTLLEFLKATLPHVILNQSRRSSAEEFASFMVNVDMQGFLLMTAAIIKAQGRETELVDVLAQSFSKDYQAIQRFGEVFDLSNASLMKSTWYRDLHLAGDLGL